MSSWEVRVLEDDGTVTATYLMAESREALYALLEEVAPDLCVIGVSRVS